MAKDDVNQVKIQMNQDGEEKNVMKTRSENMVREAGTKNGKRSKVPDD